MVPFSSVVKKKLLNIIREISKNPDPWCMHPGRDFTRNRRLPFSRLLRLLISMGGSSTRKELLSFFNYDANTISNSVFFQQRSKVRPEVFPFILKQFNSCFPLTRYQGKYQLIAIDGSTFTYPENQDEPDCFFGSSDPSKRGCNQVHVVASFDLESDRYTDAVMQAEHKKNECDAMCQLVDNADTSNSIPIFIADRGFYSLNVLGHAVEKGAYCLIRTRDEKTNKLLGDDKPDSDTYDVTVHRILSRSENKKKRKHPELAEEYRKIPQNTRFDLVPQDSDKEYGITVRFLRFKITDTTYETITTNLPEDLFSLEDIKNLYSMRWGLETAFRTLKHTLGAESLHSKKKDFVVQELWARIILYDFCSIITAHVEIMQKTSKYQQHADYSVAFSACREFLRSSSKNKKLDIEALISNNTQPTRPDRSNARNKRPKKPASFQYRQ